MASHMRATGVQPELVLCSPAHRARETLDLVVAHVLFSVWGYSPIGTNYTYSLWAQPDDFVERVLTRDMELLRAMGVNMIRQGPDIPPRWGRTWAWWVPSNV